MVMEYCEKYYVPGRDLCQKLSDDGMRLARALGQWKANIRARWSEIRILSVREDVGGTAGVGDSVKIQAKVNLGTLTPNDAVAQIYFGALNADRQLEKGDVVPMEMKQKMQDGSYIYEGAIPCRQSGLQGYSVRIIPFHPDIPNPLRLGLITWANA
jgi:starch phosphorylase